MLDPEPSTAQPNTAGPTTAQAPAPSVKFAALRNASCRPYLGGAALAMMADNIEHVITYWVIWEKFHSPALTGFEVISHWLPFLLLSPYFGALADRYDCRKLIQASQALFMAVSLTWGILFLTNSLTVWNACILPILHGMAGALWAPPEQLLLEDDFVGSRTCPARSGSTRPRGRWGSWQARWSARRCSSASARSTGSGSTSRSTCR